MGMGILSSSGNMNEIKVYTILQSYLPAYIIPRSSLPVAMEQVPCTRRGSTGPHWEPGRCDG